MNYRRWVPMVFGLAVAATLPVAASEQGMNSTEIVASVAFEFNVGETTFPAGSYTISARDIGAETVEIRPSRSKDITTVPVITRLAQRARSAKKVASSLVFDKVGDTRYLSEVWIPGREGYLVRGTTEGHEHVLVDSN